MRVITNLPLPHLAIVSQSALGENPEKKGVLHCGSGDPQRSSLAGAVGETKWVGPCGCALGVRKGQGRRVGAVGRADTGEGGRHGNDHELP